jgi:hypothetical protein
MITTLRTRFDFCFRTAATMTATLLSFGILLPPPILAQSCVPAPSALIAWWPGGRTAKLLPRGPAAQPTWKSGMHLIARIPTKTATKAL